ncbi:MAG: hypothetical protein F6K56_43320, partial [Moorea sp. SIO3G5]|nr:hypothetical protein [Moorena sp. SIO3G5]
MLWLAMVLASIVIHLCFLWILYMLLMGRFESSQPNQDLIAIDLIDIIPEDIAEQETSPEDPSTALIDQTTDLALTSPRSEGNLNHQTVSNSTIDATEGEVKPTPTEDILPVKD